MSLGPHSGFSRKYSSDIGPARLVFVRNFLMKREVGQSSGLGWPHAASPEAQKPDSKKEGGEARLV